MRGIQKLKGSLLLAIVTAMIFFAALPLASSFAETVTYTYDSMNRLKQAQYASGLTIAYDYDGMGNMVQRGVASTDTTAPTTPVIASPVNGGVINASNVTLSGTAEALSMVKVYNGATLLGGTTADATGAWAYITTLLADGSYSFSATATDAAGNASGASTVVVATIQTSAPTTTASPVGGTYNSAQNVTLTCFDGTGSGCDKIYYTTDGTTPTTSSSVYSIPISISSTTTPNYFATNLSGHSETVKSQTYTIDSTPPITTASPAGGSYNTTQNVTLTCDDGAGSGCDKIYYTTDGTMPTTSSNVYSGAISIATTTTLKYFAADLAGNSEPVKSETYTLPNCYWTNTSGGNWSTATNWSCGHAPTFADSAFITQNGTYTVTLDTNATVNDLVIGSSFGTQSLSANSKTLTINGASTVGNHAAMNLSSSTVSGAGSITSNGTISLTNSTFNTALVNGGTMNVYGTSALNGAFTTQSGSLLHVEVNVCNGSTTFTVANGFTNNGTIELVEQGSGCADAVSLAVSSGTLVNAADGSINSLTGNGYGTRSLYAVLNNQGTMTINYPLTIDKWTAVHTNSGTINANANLSIITGTSFTNTGTITIASGTTMKQTYGTFNQNAGGTISGAGTLSLNTLTANIQTSLGVKALSLSGASANLTSDMDLGSLSLSLTSSTVSGPITITNPAGKTLNLINSTLNTALVNGGTVNVYQWSAVTGALVTQSGSLLRLETTCSLGNASLTVAGGFTNNGVIDIASSCGAYDTTLTVTSGTLVNAPGGSINSPTGPNSPGWGRYLYAVLNNQGTVTINYPLSIDKWTAAHTNSGTISVNANLTVSQAGGSFTNSGTITIASGTTMKLTYGTFNQNAGATLSGAGGLSLSSITANMQTAIGVGALTLTNASANVTSDIDLGTLTLSLSGSTVNGPVTITNPAGKTLNLINSTLNTALVNGGTVNVYQWSAVTGALVTQAGSLLRLETTCSLGSASLTVAGGFTNNGVIDIASSCGAYDTTLTVTSGTLVNAPGGSINSPTGPNSPGWGRYLYAVLNNQGTVTINYPLTIDKWTAAHTNSGTISVDANLTVISGTSFTNSGTITITTGRTLSVSGGLFNNTSSGILSGSGMVSFSSATFTNSGAINPGSGLTSGLGKLSIAGPLPQTATSVINMEIGGLAAGTSYDQLAVSGAATLNGTLNVNLANGFTPNTGDSFTLMTYGSKTGTFSAVNLPSMGKLWNTTYNPTSLVLSVWDACPTITLSPASLSVLTVGTPYSQSITATGGTGSYKYSVAGGSLPSGLALSSDGVLSGTPDAPGAYTFTVTATDTITCAGTATYTMTVQTSCITPPSGLVSWWQGEGDAGDQMSRNTGSLTNGAMFTTGRVGQAFSFDGVDDAVQAGSAGLPTGEGDRTMSMWVKTAQPAATDAVFAGYGAQGVNDQLYMLGATGGNTLFFSNGTTSLIGPNLQNGRWHHAAVTNSGNLVTLYLDGAVVGSGILNLSTPANSAFFIGYLDADRKLNGAIDEAQVYGRALTATEIADIYHTGSNGLCDNVAPTVPAAGPANGAAINSPITAAFSEAMDAATINAVNFTVSGATGAVTYDAATKTAAFTPSAELAYNTAYIATITTAVKDQTGNAMAADYSWSFTTEPSPDSAAPTTTASPAGGVYNAPQNVTLTCSDGEGTGCDKVYYTIDGSEPTTASGVYTAPVGIGVSTTIRYFAVDRARNAEAVKSQTYIIDTAAPTTTVSPSGGIYNAAQSVALTCSDEAGCAAIYYTIDGTTPTTASSRYSAPISISKTTTLNYFAVDLLGNTEAAKSETYTMDTTRPTGSIVINAGAAATNSSAVMLNLTCADANGCSGMQFSIDNVNWSTSETYAATRAWTLSAGDGAKRIYVKFKDTAGNWSAVYSAAISLRTYDLTVIGVSGPATANITQQITVSYTLKNQGGSAASGINVGIYLSTDTNITIDDVLIGTDAVSSLGAGSQVTRNRPARIPAEMAAGTWYIGVIADYTNSITETNETNNALAGNQTTVTAVPPDLGMISASAPASANITQSIAVSTTVKNLGGITGGFSVGFYLSPDNLLSPDDIYIGARSVATLAAGAQSTASVQARIPAATPAGIYYLIALADFGAEIVETSEDNNTIIGNMITITTELPDLSVTAVAGPASANITEPMTISATLKNTGGATSNSSVSVYLSADDVITTGDRLLGSIPASGVIPAGEMPMTATLRVPPGMPAGTYYIGALADAANAIAEIDEGNNTVVGNIVTTTAERPDLLIAAVSGPTGANVTEPAATSLTLKNTGGVTGNFSVRVYLSADADITTGDTLLGSITVPGTIPAGGELPLTTSLRVPASVIAGDYTLGAIVDPANQITELTETNNALAGNYMVVTADLPDLIMTTVAAPATGTTGQPITVSAGVKNLGGTTGGFYVGIYLSTDATITTGDTRIGTYYVDSIAAGAEQATDVSVTIPATTSRTYYIGAIADYSRVVTESLETNNAIAGNKITISP